VDELLNHKWNKIALPSFMLQLASFAVFLGFLTSYVLLLPNPRGSVCGRTSKYNLIMLAMYSTMFGHHPITLIFVCVCVCVHVASSRSTGIFSTRVGTIVVHY